MPGAGASDDQGSAKCYNNGTPGLTDGQCETSYWATPGREVYAFSIPGSASKYACCDRATASQCYIIPTPGGLNPGETFTCTATSSVGSAASVANGQGSDGTPAAGDDDVSAKCYNNGTPGLTDGQCETSYWATPGKEVYAFSVPGSASQYACCDRAIASQCYIIPTPGGLNAGETFNCTATSAGSAPSGAGAQGIVDTPAAGDDKGSAKCYNNGTPGLTDGQCETSYWATPGKEVYAFSIPGSASKYACCDKGVASKCYMIPTPGGLNAGETFDCTPTSQASAAQSEGRAQRGVKTPVAERHDDEGSALCYNNGTPGLTDGQCETSYWATPGKEVYAFNVPGSASKYACCNKASASKCTIIPTPGGLNPGETFVCSPAGGSFNIIP